MEFIMRLVGARYVPLTTRFRKEAPCPISVNAPVGVAVIGRPVDRETSRIDRVSSSVNSRRQGGSNPPSGDEFLRRRVPVQDRFVCCRLAKSDRHTTSHAGKK